MVHEFFVGLIIERRSEVALKFERVSFLLFMIFVAQVGDDLGRWVAVAVFANVDAGGG